MWTRYRITPEAFDELRRAQQNQCAICRRPFPKDRAIHIDHDHGTGAVRGLLCFLCNSGLGMFADDVSVLTAAVQYLKEDRGE
jgi:hypothetical protein